MYLVSECQRPTINIWTLDLCGSVVRRSCHFHLSCIPWLQARTGRISANWDGCVDDVLLLPKLEASRYWTFLFRSSRNKKWHQWQKEKISNMQQGHLIGLHSDSLIKEGGKEKKQKDGKKQLLDFLPFLFGPKASNLDFPHEKLPSSSSLPLPDTDRFFFQFFLDHLTKLITWLLSSFFSSLITDLLLQAKFVQSFWRGIT